MKSIMTKLMGIQRQNSIKSDYIWFSLGCGVYAVFSFISTIYITRATGEMVGGMFAFGLSFAQLMANIGYFGIRTFQLTDMKNAYKLSDYFILRTIMCMFGFIVSIFFIMFQAYTWEKIAIILLLCLFKNIEGISDVLEGNFQKKGRVDLAGKSMFYRTIICLTILIAVQHFWGNILVSLIVMDIVACICVWCFNICIV